MFFKRMFNMLRFVTLPASTMAKPSCMLNTSAALRMTNTASNSARWITSNPAKSMGIDIRWGGDWDRDTEVRDNKFDDLVHFEIVE